MRLCHLALAVFGASVAVTPALAQEDSGGRSFGKIYTECGLGAALAPETPGAAAVTNVTWDLGTTAISSEVTTPESCQGVRANTAQLLLDTYNQVAADLATGRGNHLNAVMQSTGCNASVHDELAADLRERFGSAAGQEGWQERTRVERAAFLHNNLFAAVDSEYSSQCRMS